MYGLKSLFEHQGFHVERGKSAEMVIGSTVPERICIGCRLRRPKQELIRVGFDNKGNISLLPAGRKEKVEGRGCYVCPLLKCVEKAQKSDSIGRALKQKVPESVYFEMREMVTEGK